MKTVLITLVLSLSAFADTTTCDVYAALNRYHYKVTLDTTQKTLDVRTDDGYAFSGGYSFSHSGATKIDYYYLPVSFGSGMELQSDGTGKALCIQQNECYNCN